MLVTCVAGARPNFMKVKPVVDALTTRGVDVQLVHTGQHYDPSMSDAFFADLGLRDPDVHLGVGSGTQAQQTAAVMTAFEPVIDASRPEIVIVVGDINSTLACALVAAKAGPSVAHVEAGLRSRDWTMPEEVNRVVTDRVSDILLAPSPDAVDNLRHEGYRPDQIHLVGNVMIDTLLVNVERARTGSTLSSLHLEPGGYGLVTLHRPANVDDPAMLAELLGALSDIAQRLPLVFPVHPRARRAVDAITLHPAITVTEPMGYLDFVALEAGAALVLTDSGGVQEETTALGVACLTMRDTTERPITVDEGTNRLVGRRRADIISAANDVLEHGVEPRCPDLWDGHAADRIADILIAHPDTPRRRPTDVVSA